MDTKLLKQKILDLAIHGKLVPQNPADEPASVLLERIKAEKEQLIKEGKIKKEKLYKFCNEPEFVLPTNWQWSPISIISRFVTDGEHSTPERTREFEGYYLLSARNIRDGYLSLDNVDYVGKQEFDRISKRCNPTRGDILISCSGSVGRITVIEDDNQYVMVRSAAMIRPIYIDSTYIMYALQSSNLQNQMGKFIKQTAQANLFLGAITSLIIPIPPLAEQKRIVAEIDRWFKWIDELEKNQQDLHTAIQQAKSKILDLAIHGKLVPQEGEWKECTLGDLYEISSSKRVVKSEWRECGIPFYRTREIVRLANEGFVDNELFISEEHYEDLKKLYGVPVSGDIMLTAVGTIGKTYIVQEDDCFYYKDASVLRLHAKGDILPKFSTLVFQSEFMQKQMYDNSKGTTVDTITMEKARNYVFFQPTVNEQKRIVSKIEELYTQLDKIEQALN